MVPRLRSPRIHLSFQSLLACYDLVENISTKIRVTGLQSQRCKIKINVLYCRGIQSPSQESAQQFRIQDARHQPDPLNTREASKPETKNGSKRHARPIGREHLLFRDIHKIFGSEKAKRYESETEMGYLEELRVEGEGNGENAGRGEGDK